MKAAAFAATMCEFLHPLVKPMLERYEYKVYSFDPAKRTDDIKTDLDRLGMQGWKLVGIAGWFLFFMRIVEQVD